MGKARLKEDPKRVVELSGQGPTPTHIGISEDRLVILKAELDSIRSLRGKLTAEAVLSEARHKGSPLHEFFEWDNAKAAHDFRLSQARGLIRRVYVVYADGTRARAFVHSSSAAAYLPEREVRKSDVLLAVVTNGAMRELAFWCFRYEHLDELGPYIAKVRAVIEEFQSTQTPSPLLATAGSEGTVSERSGAERI